MTYEAHEVPLPDGLIEELLAFWEPIFGTLDEDMHEVLSGGDRAYNRNVVYAAREGSRVVGTTQLTISRSLPALGGLGQVATAPESRRRGIAGRLCGEAVAEFRTHNGEAIFLGTGNPVAARVYDRLGWRKLAGADVMVNVLSADSPGAFLVDYFKTLDEGEIGTVTVAEGTAACRLPMIPLLVCPHDWHVLDANTRMYSTRYSVQRSCMGLYPRYRAIAKGGRGAWFGASTSRGKLLGLSSVRIVEPDWGRVDGLAHQGYPGILEGVLRAAVNWAAERGICACRASVCPEDEEKQCFFESLGFREAGAGEDFDLEGRSAASVRMEKTWDSPRSVW